MANISITPNKINSYDSSISVSKTSMDYDSSLVFDVDGVSDERLQIFLDVTAGQADFTIQDGATHEDAVLSSMVTASVATGTTKVFALSSSRFKDANDDITIEVNGSSLTGTAYAVSFPMAK